MNQINIIGHINIVDKPNRHSHAICDSCNKKFFGDTLMQLHSDGDRQICIDCLQIEEDDYWQSLNINDICEYTIFD